MRGQLTGMSLGLQVYTDERIFDHVPPQLTWIDKVLAWNPCNPWRPPPRVVPKAQVYRIGTQLVMHPEMLGVLKSRIEDLS